MKKLIALMLTLIIGIAAVSCNNEASDDFNTNQTTSQTNPEQTRDSTEAPDIPDTTPPVVKYSMGETVSTNIADFALVNSTLTYYVSNVSTNYGEPTDKPNTMFAAKVGTCYVSMTVTIKNNDRSGSLDFCGSYWNPGKWTVNYNGETYPLYGFDLSLPKYPSVKLNYGGALVDPETGKVFSKVGTGNKLISAGEE